MSINIKNREAARLLDELKAATGKGTSQLVLDLLRQEAQRTRNLGDREKRRHAVLAIAARYRRRMKGQPRPHEEIIGYDENGLPL